jgi:hypothetical protein
MRMTSLTSLTKTVSVLALTLSLAACGEERHQATAAEQETVLGVIATGLHLRDHRSTDRVALPPGTETLIGLVIDSVCKASLSSVAVGDHTQETLTFDCKDGDFKGRYVRELDHHVLDLFAKTSLDIRYTGDVTARRDFLDGKMTLIATKDLWITDIGVSDHIDFLGVQFDPSGCAIGGAMTMKLHANLPGKKVDLAADAVFGPTCGEIWVKEQ